MKLLKSNWVFLPIVALGAIAGLVWWNFYGCTDACPINSSWKISMLRGGLITLAVGMVFLPLKKNTQVVTEESKN